MRYSSTLAGGLTVFALATLTILPAAAQVDERLWGMSMIGVDKAWAQGFYGTGVAIGIMDDAIQFDHPEYADRWMGGFNADGSPYGPLGAHYHGTHVTGTVAGVNVGVAPGSLIYGANWDIPMQSDATYARAFEWLTSRSVRAVNNSWVVSMRDPDTGDIRTRTLLDATKTDVETNFPLMLAALRASVDADVVQVFANGNHAMLQPSLLAGLPYFFPELQSNWLAVAAVGPTGTLASYSHHCGLAAAWCVSAPGGDGPEGSDDAIWSSYPNGYFSINGTSMASPHVTGSIAIAAELFPNATGAQLAQLVLQTATDIGEAGIDSTYGWGLLNVGNMVDAINPATAGAYAHAAWSRAEVLKPANAIMRQQLGMPAADLGAGPVVTAAPVEPRVWLSPVYGVATIAGGGASSSADGNVAGLLAGVDVLRDEQFQLGLALGYSHTGLKTQSGADRIDTNALHLGAYGLWQQGAWYVLGTGQAAALGQSIERRAIAGAVGVSFDPVGRASLSGAAFGASIEVGHQFDLPNELVVSPYLAGAANWQSTGAGAEDGAGIFSLALPATHASQFQIGPGLRLESAPIQWEDKTLRFTADVSYARVLGEVDNATTVALLGREITGQTAELGRDVLRIGGKLDLSTGGGQNWFAAYDGSFRQGASTHVGNVGFKVSF